MFNKLKDSMMLWALMALFFWPELTVVLVIAAFGTLVGILNS